MTASIRPAGAADLPRLLDMYNHYVVNTAITFDIDPLTIDERRGWLAQFSDSGRHRLFVAEEDGSVFGYAGSTRVRPKAAYDQSVETTIYVAPEAVGRRLGDPLYSALFDALGREGVHVAVAAIAIPNPASVALHERFGFTLLGVMHEVGRKFDRYWDVAWYEKLLD